MPVIEQTEGGLTGIEVVIDKDPADLWREVPSGLYGAEGRLS